MALFNYATKEITLKIVYYGPGLSGKTTNLQYLHSVLNPQTKGKLLSLSTESDRTLFFDFLPIELGKIKDFSIRFQLYTVPGQIRYNATRKVVLKGADAVIFVADSQRDMKDQNIESFLNMRENLFSNNINPDEIPIILQYNKRDLKNISTIEEINAYLNKSRSPVFEAAAINGNGVEDTFKHTTKLLIKNISQKHKIEFQPSVEKEGIQDESASKRPDFTPQESIAVGSLPETTKIQVPDVKRILSEPDLASQWMDLDQDIKHSDELEEAEELIEAEEVVAAIEVDQEDHDTPSHLPSSEDQPLEFPSEKEAKEPFGYELRKETLPTSVACEDVVEVLPSSAHDFDSVVGEIAKLNGLLKELTDSVTLLSADIKKGREETASALRDLMNSLQEIKTKKSWLKM